MKRILIIALALAFFVVPAFAAWTTSPTSGNVIAKKYGTNSYQVTILFTCDGSASGALDLNTLMSVAEFGKINGGFLMSVDVVPGTSGVAPDGAYDVNVYNSAGVQTIDATTTSEATKHTYPTNAGAVATPQQIFGSVPFDIGDIGTTGDQVTLKFNVYNQQK
jgi:hypothetical protein